MHNVFQTHRENIVFALHKLPDADCVASVYIVYEILKKQYSNKKFFIVSDNNFNVPFPKQLSPINEIKVIKNTDLPPDSCVYVLDHSDPSFSLLKNFEDANIGEMIIIDHHPYYSTGKTGRTRNLVNIKAISTTEVLYDNLDPEDINKDIATAIYIGILSDGINGQKSLKEKQFKDINDLITKYGVEVDNNKLYTQPKSFAYKRVISEIFFLHARKSKRSDTVTINVPNHKLKRLIVNYVSIPHLAYEALCCWGVLNVIIKYEYAPGYGCVRIITKDIEIIKELDATKQFRRPDQHGWSNLDEESAKKCAKNLGDKLARRKKHLEPIDAWENIGPKEK